MYELSHYICYLILNITQMKKLKKLSRNDLKTVKGGQVWIAETSCGIIATTTQDWSPEQANEWRDKVETINCPAPTHSGPSESLV